MESSFWRKRSVFVTGATGSLGSWLVRALLERGARVTALVRGHEPMGYLETALRNRTMHTVQGQLTDADLLRHTLTQQSVQTVFHLAAQTLVGAAKQDPVGTLETNVRGTWLLLEAARQASAREVVIASSDKAYGACDRLPYREDDPLRGTFPYDVSKSCADLIGIMYARTYGLPVAMARCANLFGEGDTNTSRLIPGAIQATLKGEPFVIRSDGKFVRDFLYMQDAAAAYLVLAEALSGAPELGGEAFNFALGQRMTAIEIVHIITTMMGRSDLLPDIRNIASTEIREQYLDISKAATVLKWSPSVTLEQGLERTIQWHKTRF